MAKGGGKCPGPVAVRGEGMGWEAPPAALSRDPTWAATWRGPSAIPDGAHGCPWMCRPLPQNLRVFGSGGGMGLEVPSASRGLAWSLGFAGKAKKTLVLLWTVPVSGGGGWRVPRGSQPRPLCRGARRPRGRAFPAAHADAAEVRARSRSARRCHSHRPGHGCWR